MRCLGIPNTAHFANIILIEDAIQLWEKLKVSRETERFRPENEEEFEDSAGNVLTMKTHNDLKRQGLL
jgi:splicing factor 3A subunit 3